MSEHMFGVTRTKPTQAQIKKLDKICVEEGGYGFTWLSTPGNHIGWFSCRNKGNPFDRDLAERVLKRARIVAPDIFGD